MTDYSDFISVYSRATGEKHLVPAHFIEVPGIAKNFRLTPRQRKADEKRATARTRGPIKSAATSVAPQSTPPVGDKKE